ncbi:mammalian cell entry protein, partial [Mycobacterium sp. ITM-2017-0098]
APGDPWYSSYTMDPLQAPVTPIPAEVATIPPLVDPTGEGEPATAGTGPASSGGGN